ncbi:hypothetical protein B0H21DRAFT_868323, partial [Amylocystis lapponica]
NKKAPSLYVKIRLPGSNFKKKTNIIKNSYDPVWDETFTIMGLKDTSSEVQFDLKHHEAFLRELCFGTFKIRLDQLIIQCIDNPCSLDLKIQNQSDWRSKLGWHLEVHLKKSSIQDPNTVQEVIAGFQENPHFTQIAGSSSPVEHSVKVIGGVADAIESQTPLERILGTLLFKLGTVKNIVDELSKVHPYVNAAWHIVSAVLKIIKAQRDRDQEIVELVTAMIDVLSFSEDAQAIDQLYNRQQYLHKMLSQVMPQIWECALFVQEYIADGFAKRLKHQTFSDFIKLITNMKNNLFMLRSSLDSGSVIHTAITSSQILEKVHDMYLRDHLKPAEMDVFYRKECLSGTRQEVMTYILDQLLNTNQRILWMHGPAGSGKSTIATTIANYFVGLHRCGAFVFFDRSRAEASSPKHVIRTIAHQLGLHDPFMQAALVKMIQDEGDIDMLQPSVQFTKLLIQSLHNAQTMHTRPGPIIIIIDALDECGTAQERQTLLQLISKNIIKLPSNYHFFITSRPEQDIVRWFSEKLHIKEMTLDITLQSNQNDVQIFLEQSMAQIQQTRSYLPIDWPGQTAKYALLQRAAGLFIWAYTAITFMELDNDPQGQLEIILSSKNKEEADSSLYSLYETVLQTTNIWRNPGSKISINWHKVLGLLVVANAPLTDVMIDKMLDLKDAQCCYWFFQQIRSLLHWSPGHTVQLLHASIADYLTDKKRCGDKPWFIDVAIYNDIMTKICLHIMKTELHFN